MNKYETVFILNPVLSESQVKETVEKFSSFIKGLKSKITHEENWGLKKLKYPIQNKRTGFYHMFEHESDPQTTKELEVEFKRDERVLRWLSREKRIIFDDESIFHSRSSLSFWRISISFCFL